jgi:hypothetical protein
MGQMMKLRMCSKELKCTCICMLLGAIAQRFNAFIFLFPLINQCIFIQV